MKFLHSAATVKVRLPIMNKSRAGTNKVFSLSNISHFLGRRLFCLEKIMKKFWRYIILISYVIISCLLVFISIRNIDKEKTNQVVNKINDQKQEVVEDTKINNSKIVNEPNKNSVVKISATIIIDKLILKPSFENGKSLYDVLNMEKEKANLNLVGKNFSGMGFFVSEIGTLKENSDQQLIYFVNNKSPNIGISNYILKDKDVVEWKLK